MHHVILERWSRRESFVHARDARVKVAALLVFLLVLATTPQSYRLVYLGDALLIVATILLARLPAIPLLMRAGLVLPFSAVFALVSWMSGDSGRAVALVLRSYLSASAVLTIVATTRLPDLLRALSWYRVPSLLILIAQFLYRYLFVLSEQAQHMRLAARCRTGEHSTSDARKSRFAAAAGALAVLFSRSYQRASGIHQAMLSRGFQGHFPAIENRPLRAADFGFLLVSIAVLAAVRAVQA